MIKVLQAKLLKFHCDLSLASIRKDLQMIENIHNDIDNTQKEIEEILWSIAHN